MDYSDPRRGPVAGSYNRGKARSTKYGVFLQYPMYLSYEDDSFSRGSGVRYSNSYLVVLIIFFHVN
jgi:hypothetical protein